jgi:hypothetical protein
MKQNKIHKFKLDTITKAQTTAGVDHLSIVHFDYVDGEFYFWAVVDEEFLASEDRLMTMIVPTGFQYDTHWAHNKTIIVDGLVWHLLATCQYIIDDYKEDSVK